MSVVTEPIILDETGQDIVTQLQAIVAGLAPNAGQISYSNATSGLSATKVQQAIDEVDGNVDTLSNSLTQLSETLYGNATVQKSVDNVSINFATESISNLVGVTIPSGFRPSDYVRLAVIINEISTQKKYIGRLVISSGGALSFYYMPSYNGVETQITSSNGSNYQCFTVANYIV